MKDSTLKVTFTFLMLIVTWTYSEVMGQITDDGNNNNYFSPDRPTGSYGKLNTLVGNDAPIRHDGGNSNSFFGAHIGLWKRFSSYNTLIGAEVAGASANNVENINSVHNTFLGSKSGYNVKGSYNTFLGSHSG
ncbi:hypothetical protein E1171_02320, partial [Cytophagales bacterium RKSG123]|nr:hypothetical protein [Xanthovirga aplysinae]